MTTPALGQYEFAVLVTVAHLDGTAYGAALRRELSKRLRREQSIGAVYTTLARLEDKGLLESWLADPEPVRGGRSRRFYRLTTAGAAAVRAARATNERLLSRKAPRWRPA